MEMNHEGFNIIKKEGLVVNIRNKWCDVQIGNTIYYGAYIPHELRADKIKLGDIVLLEMIKFDDNKLEPEKIITIL